MLRLNRQISTLLFPARCLGCETEIDAKSACPPKHKAKPNKNGKPHVSNLATNSDSASDLTVHDLDAFSSHWCLDCWRRLNDHSPRCQKCGATFSKPNPLNDRCALCRDLDLRFESTVSISDYRGLIQDLVIRMKNQHDDQLAIQLGRLLALHITQSDFYDEIDLIIPIPINRWRRLRRGFNGAEIISESIGHSCGLTYSNRVLKCLRQTKKQGTLSTVGRFKNVRNAFGLYRKANVSGLTVMLIDDVMTSGATSSEAARILMRAGARKVYAGVIARGARVS